MGTTGLESPWGWYLGPQTSLRLKIWSSSEPPEDGSLWGWGWGPQSSLGWVSAVLRDFFSAPRGAHRGMPPSPWLPQAPAHHASPLRLQVLHCSGHLRVYKPPAQTSSAGSPHLEPPLQCLVLICEAIPHPDSLEPPLGRGAFLSRHSLDMKFTYCDDRWAGARRPPPPRCPAPPLPVCPSHRVFCGSFYL